MKKEQNEELYEMFRDTFSKVEASQQMKENFKTNVAAKQNTKFNTKVIEESGMEPNRKKGKLLFLKTWQKIALTAACFMLVICAFNFNTIKAGIINAYEYFFQHVEETYDENTNEYALDIHQNFQLEEGYSLECSQAIFLEDGIDFKFLNAKDTGKYDFVGCEAYVEYKNRVYELDSDAYTKMEHGYLVSLVFDDEKQCRWHIGEPVTIHITMKYIEDTQERAIKLEQKDFVLELTPEKIKKAQYCTADKQEIYQDDRIRIQSIELKGWYMKVTYDTLYEFDAGEETLRPAITVNGRELLLLFAEVAGTSTQSTIEDGKVIEESTEKERSVAYLELPENMGDEFEVKSVCSKFDGTKWHDTQSSGKHVTVHWKLKK